MTQRPTICRFVDFVLYRGSVSTLLRLVPQGNSRVLFWSDLPPQQYFLPTCSLSLRGSEERMAKYRQHTLFVVSEKVSLRLGFRVGHALISVCSSIFGKKRSSRGIRRTGILA